MSIPDLTEVCGPCNECMGPEAAKTDPDDAAIIGIKVTSCLKKCAPCVKDFLNVYCTMSPTRVMITQPCCYDLSASVSKLLLDGFLQAELPARLSYGMYLLRSWCTAGQGDA